MAVNPGNELLDNNFSKIVLRRLTAVAVSGHDDDKRRDFAIADQAVCSFICAQAVPLVVGVALPMDEIKDRIRIIGILSIAWWGINSEVER